MRRIFRVGLAVLGLISSATVYGGEPCGCAVAPTCGPVVEDCGCQADRWHFRIERTETWTKVEVPTEKRFSTPSRVTCEQTLPCGDKVKTTVTDIVPVEKCGSKLEPKLKVCTTVYMHCGPVVAIQSAAKVPPPPLPMPPGPEPIAPPMPK